MVDVFYVLARDGRRTARTIPRNRGGNLATTRPAPWRAISAHDEMGPAVDAMLEAAQRYPEVSVAARSALPALEITLYDTELDARTRASLGE
jgi:hypothetical protein